MWWSKRRLAAPVMLFGPTTVTVSAALLWAKPDDL
jgi:hypothetical protein